MKQFASERTHAPGIHRANYPESDSAKRNLTYHTFRTDIKKLVVVAANFLLVF